jgi:hypothetical protein
VRRRLTTPIELRLRTGFVVRSAPDRLETLGELLGAQRDGPYGDPKERYPRAGCGSGALSLRFAPAAPAFGLLARGW